MGFTVFFLYCDGKRFHLQEDWQVHHEALVTTKERVIGYPCLDAELLGAESERCDWANTEFIGHSWLKDDQFAATTELPFFDAMKTRPPEINITGKRVSTTPLADKEPTVPPPNWWVPYLAKHAKHRLGITVPTKAPSSSNPSGAG